MATGRKSQCFWTWLDFLSCISKASHNMSLLQVGHSKTVNLHFSKDPEGYGTKKSSGRPQKITPVLSRRIRWAVCQDTVRPLSQIKAMTGADCSPITIRQHLQRNGFKTKNIFKGHVSFNARKLSVWTLQGSIKNGTFKGGGKFYSLMRKN